MKRKQVDRLEKEGTLMLEERKGKVAKHGVPYSEFVLCISTIQVHPTTPPPPPPPHTPPLTETELFMKV